MRSRRLTMLPQLAAAAALFATGNLSAVTGGALGPAPGASACVPTSKTRPRTAPEYEQIRGYTSHRTRDPPLRVHRDDPLGPEQADTSSKKRETTGLTGNMTSVTGGALGPGAQAFVPTAGAPPRHIKGYASTRSHLRFHRDTPLSHSRAEPGDASTSKPRDTNGHAHVSPPRGHSHTSPLFREAKPGKPSASALHAYQYQNNDFLDRSMEQKGAALQSVTPASPSLPAPMLKSPKEAYDAFADKGMQNAKKSFHQVIHQSILGGAYVGFAGLLSLVVAGNLPGLAESNPGLIKMAFAALFPCNLLFIATTGGQLFTGNSATVAAARYEGKVTDGELARSLGVSLLGNVIGCGAMALAAAYTGILTGGAANLCSSMASAKCLGASVAQIFVKAVLCNWMVSLALYLSGAASDITGKLVGIWFPISTFVAIGLEHSIANLFLLPSALLLKVPGITLGKVIFSNLIPAILGNAVGGALIVAGSYSYQFGSLGKRHRKSFGARLREYEERKERERVRVQHVQLAEASYQLPAASH